MKHALVGTFMIAMLVAAGADAMTEQTSQQDPALRTPAQTSEGFTRPSSQPAYDWGRGGPPKSDEEAVARWREAAEQGRADAQANLGGAYSTGSGVPKDEVQAVAWYRKAAEQGHVKAQANLAMAYGAGRGVPQDDAEAVGWFRRAAEQGEAFSQFCLGSAYRMGRGVPPDDAQAGVWFLKAAEQGQPDAQLVLGAMYANGVGVPQDNAEGYKWRSIAVMLAPLETQRRRYAAERDALGEWMAAQDRAAGEARARAWLAAFENRK